MRTDVFYWKCDSGISPEQKRQAFFKGKYNCRKRNDCAFRIAERFSGKRMQSFTQLRADGNHLTYRFEGAGKNCLLRLDPGGIEDDYMLAESAVMNLLHSNGFPVPRIFETDISMKEFPCRWQIMEFVDEKCLNAFAGDGTLDEKAIAEQSGVFLAKLHRFRFPGYGFLNTDKLKTDGVFQGLDADCSGYFRKKLSVHLDYLAGHGFLSENESETIKRLFLHFEPLLNFGEGSLLHRDFTYWNILGTRDAIRSVIDWDDCVIGDPMDDLGIVSCFQEREFMERLVGSYSEITPIGKEERIRIRLHTLRNMLWKTMIRDYMGYFEKGTDFFLVKAGCSLRDSTIRKLKSSIGELEECR